MENTITIDFADSKQVKKLMEDYHDIDYPLCAENEEGKRQLIHVGAESVIVETFQHNGWIRVTEYDADGECCGETFKK